VEVERVKSKLRALYPNSSNQKEKWVERGPPSKSLNQNVKKHALANLKSRPISLAEPCGKRGYIDHTTLKC